MKTININDTLNSLDDLVLAKIDIENDLINEGKLKEKHNVTDFLSELNIASSIYSKNGVPVPFKLLKSNTQSYLFYSCTLPDKKEVEKIIKALTTRLQTVNYNISKLKHKTIMDVFNENILESEYFIINAEYYI